MKYHIGKNVDFGWYVSNPQTKEYLHPDGVWRDSTMNSKGEYTGYYSSKEEANNILKNFTSNVSDTKEKIDIMKLIREAAGR